MSPGLIPRCHLWNYLISWWEEGICNFLLSILILQAWSGSLGRLQGLWSHGPGCFQQSAEVGNDVVSSSLCCLGFLSLPAANLWASILSGPQPRPPPPSPLTYQLAQQSGWLHHSEFVAASWVSKSNSCLHFPTAHIWPQLTNGMLAPLQKTPVSLPRKHKGYGYKTPARTENWDSVFGLPLYLFSHALSGA